MPACCHHPEVPAVGAVRAKPTRGALSHAAWSPFCAPCLEACTEWTDQFPGQFEVAAYKAYEDA